MFPRLKTNIVNDFLLDNITAMILVVAITFVTLVNQVTTVTIPEKGVMKFGKEISVKEVLEKEGLNYGDIAVSTKIGVYEFINDIELKPLYSEKVEEEIEEEVEEFTVNLEDYDFELTGYVTAGVLNIRAKDDTESDILQTINWNSKINYSIYNDNWGIINLDGQAGFVYLKYISDTKSDGIEIPVTGDKRKSFMSYKKITAKGTKQYDIKNASYTDYETGVRMYKERYCIAVGSGYGASVGQYVDVTLENGEVIKCIISDAKADCDTNSSNTVGNDGSVAEFIIDPNAISKEVKDLGDLSYALPEWDSNVVEIELYDKAY